MAAFPSKTLIHEDPHADSPDLFENISNSDFYAINVRASCYSLLS